MSDSVKHHFKQIKKHWREYPNMPYIISLHDLSAAGVDELMLGLRQKYIVGRASCKGNSENPELLAVMPTAFVKTMVQNQFTVGKSHSKVEEFTEEIPPNNPAFFQPISKKGEESGGFTHFKLT